MFHLPRRAVACTAPMVLMGALLLSGCEQPLPAPAVSPLLSSLPPPEEIKELVVLFGPGPASYFPGVDGEPSGFDVDLLRLFARHKNLPLRFLPADQPSQLLADIELGTAHIGTGGLYRPSAAPSRSADNAMQDTNDRW